MHRVRSAMPFISGSAACCISCLMGIGKENPGRCEQPAEPAALAIIALSGFILVHPEGKYQQPPYSTRSSDKPKSAPDWDCPVHVIRWLGAMNWVFSTPWHDAVTICREVKPEAVSVLVLSEAAVLADTEVIMDKKLLDWGWGGCWW